MANPKKRRGFRSIEVEGIQYRWRFQPSIPDSLVRIMQSEAKGQTLVVQMIGWVDPWLSLSGFHVEENVMHLYSNAANVPPIITAKFVRQIIQFALTNGWNPEVSGPDFQMTSQKGEFGLQGE